MSSILSFSIPNRIEPSATSGQQHDVDRPVRFQYPQSDRALCNLTPRSVAIVCFDFQYPQSDRALCNSQKSVGDIGVNALSVSPIGSSPLQPCATPLLTSVSPAFSIPNRIEPSATIRSDTAINIARFFQYPQSDRALCNSPSGWTALASRQTFSIPNRIEPSATSASKYVRKLALRLSVSPIGSSPLQPRHRSRGRWLHEDNFQYPQSDRALCNTC